MFGKLMSISDEMMWRYYDLLSFKTNKEIDKLKKLSKTGSSLMEAKLLLGFEIVERFHGKNNATKALNEFKNRFSQKNDPTEIHAVIIKVKGNSLNLIDVLSHPDLKERKFCKSKSDAKRMINQSAVRVEGKRISDENFRIKINSKTLFQVGKKRFLKITLKSMN